MGVATTRLRAATDPASAGDHVLGGMGRLTGRIGSEVQWEETTAKKACRHGEQVLSVVGQAWVASER